MRNSAKERSNSSVVRATSRSDDDALDSKKGARGTANPTRLRLLLALKEISDEVGNREDQSGTDDRRRRRQSIC
jgi:hypothetical protein